MELKRTPAICIINGYPKASRDNFDQNSVGHPHNFFKDFLMRHFPGGVSIDVLYVADSGERLPGGAALSSYDG